MEKHLPNETDPTLIEPLTERELEIVQLLADGWTDREIGDHLILSLNTVKWYNKRLYGKLAVKNRTEAVKRIRELGLLNPATAVTPQASHISTPAHNLPAATTPFIGRELELNELDALLADEKCRLVTIMAAGGMGKSRFSLQVAQAQLANFRHGVYFIPLAQLRTAENIIPALAAQLQVRSLAEVDPMAYLLEYLHDKQMLLVLDNFEHLLDGANLVTTLLEGAPGVKILATSRERLNLRTEHIYLLPGLALPTSATRRDILNCSATQLFIQRMQMTAVSTELTDDDLQNVQRICQQVGGMPLGIELAASLVDVLSPAEIAAEIDENADVLATEMQDMPPRLRSIRAVFDYSWTLLSEAEREVYQRLALFRGGFTREAAQAVADANLRVLQRLVNKSLLQREVENGRYVLHELLRQYAEERLKATGQAAATNQALAEYYAGFMAQCGRQIKGKGQLEGLNLVETDFENVRAAWQWAVARRDFAVLSQLWEALYWFCVMRARVPDGMQLFQQARTQLNTAVAQDVHPVQRRFRLRFNSSNPEHGAQIEQMLAMARQSDDLHEVAFLLWVWGVHHFLEGDFHKAIPNLEEAVERLGAVGEDFYKAESLHWLGVCHRFIGEVAKAEAYAAQIREFTRRTGNQFALARILGSRGIYEVFKEDNAEAIRDLHEAIALRTELGDKAGVAISLSGLGTAAFFQGNFEQAQRYAEESLALAMDNHSSFPHGAALVVLSWLAAAQGAYDEALRLCQESQKVSSNPNALAMGQLGTVIALCGREAYAAAREQLVAFAQNRNPMHTLRGYFSFASALAILLAAEGEAEKAVELLGLIFTHPQSPTGWLMKWQLLGHWQTRLQAELGKERYGAAWERGQQLDITAVFANLPY